MGRGHGATMVNVRMPDEVIDQVETAATKDHLKRSTWCREVLVAAVRSGIGLEQLTTLLAAAQASPQQALFPTAPPPEPGPKKLGARRVLTGQCLHPVHTVRRYPTRDVCGNCDEVVRHR